MLLCGGLKEEEEAVEDMFGEDDDMDILDASTAPVIGGLDQNVFDNSVNEDFFGEEEEIAVVNYCTEDEEDTIKLDSSKNNVRNLDFGDCDDLMDDGQDSFLLAASQVVLDPKPEIPMNKVPEVFKPPPIHQALSRLHSDQDGFGTDDSFEDALSQMPMGFEQEQAVGAASPVLKRRRALSSTATPKLTEISPNLQAIKPPATSKVDIFKKHSSFDQSTPKLGRSSSFKRIKSSPVISQYKPEQSQPCSKQEIERKKREAMARSREKQEAKRNREKQEEVARINEKQQLEFKRAKEKQELETKMVKEKLELEAKEEQKKRNKEVMERKRMEALARRAASQSQKQSIKPGSRSIIA